MDTMRPPSVGIVHSRLLIGEALGRLLTAAGCSVTAVCTDTDTVRRALRERPAEAVLFDADAVTREPHLTTTVRREAPDARLLLLADAPDASVARWSLDAGMDGVVLCTSSGSQLAAALEQVTAGQAVYPSGWLAAARAGEDQAERLGLSGRQLEVLELMAAGATNDDIARRLVISPNTVKFHVAAIYSRLGVHTRVEAAAALASGAVLAAAR